jgi:DNA-directed RNA polymerase subunit RPC12/RpoP
MAQIIEVDFSYFSNHSLKLMNLGCHSCKSKYQMTVHQTTEASDINCAYCNKRTLYRTTREYA